MKPRLDALIIGAATTIATRLIPAISEESYAMGDAQLTALTLILVAQEVDRAADTLWRENAAMRVLFGDLADQPALGDMRDDLRAAALTTDQNLRISTLSVAHDGLSSLLIMLHTRVEEIDEDWAKAANRSILRLLKDGAAARMVAMPPT